MVGVQRRDSCISRTVKEVKKLRFTSAELRQLTEETHCEICARFCPV